MMTFRAMLLMTGALLLAGCGASTEDELRQWMVDQKNQSRPRIAPISEPKQFKPESYAQFTAVDPFSNQKLTLALKKDSATSTSNSALIDPELARRKEALESFPLDTMSMVGNMVKANQPVALLKIDSLLYQVRTGNYLGQNYGRVTKISETEVTLREIVQDAAGEWIERTATLQLQERSK
jgi:type IV pilus assembly protein PilP